jgi:hypothetical protein
MWDMAPRVPEARTLGPHKKDQKEAGLGDSKRAKAEYTSDELATLEYLETFRSGRGLTSVH